MHCLKYPWDCGFVTRNLLTQRKIKRRAYGLGSLEIKFEEQKISFGGRGKYLSVRHCYGNKESVWKIM